MQRMNVKLALNVFDSSTVSALYQKEGSEETAFFCDYISKWWRIMNVKNLSKGIEKRDEFSSAITSPTHKNFEFLKKFVDWLKDWNSSDVNKENRLTKETFEAAVLTTQSFIQFCLYSFETLETQFVLSGKLSTDGLEGRFRLYRSLNGCNYHVSINQILEAEKKIRLNNIVKSCENIKDVVPGSSYDASKHTSTIEEFFDQITCVLDLDDVNLGERIYVAGVVAHKICSTLICEHCRKVFYVYKGENEGDKYFDFLQRGGLVSPSAELKIMLLYMVTIFEKILSNKELKSNFLKNKTRSRR